MSDIGNVQAQGSNEDQTLFTTLTQTHPVYDHMKPEWDRYTDVTESIIDSDKYLHRTVHEDINLFDFRKSISEFIPECPLAIRSIENAIGSQRPRRNIPSNLKNRVAPFVDNADLNGNSLDSVNIDILRGLLTYGTTRILITSYVPEDVRTRYDEQVYGVQPYIVDYSPLDVINWESDLLGNLLWVVIRENYTKQASPKEKRKEYTKIIIYTTEEWEVYEFEKDSEKGTMRLVSEPDTGTHGLGVVPMIVESLRGRGVKRIDGDSFIKLSSRLDIRKFRYESDWNYDLYVHAHPLLKVLTSEELAVVGVGANAVLKLDPNQKEDAEYLNTPTSAFEALQSAIQEMRHGIYRQAGTDPLGILEPGSQTFEATGVARAWSFTTTENRILNAVATVMERIEKQEFELAVRHITGNRPEKGKRAFEGTVSYPARFDPVSTAMLLDECERIPNIINSPSFIKDKHKTYIRRASEDVPHEKLVEWEGEIDKGEVLGAPYGSVGKPLPKSPFGDNVARKMLDEDEEYTKTQETKDDSKRREEQVEAEE